MKIRTVLIAGAMLASSGVSAATWYVDDKNGSDSNDGSENAPFKTIGKALELDADFLGEGEIIVAPGVYKLGGTPISGSRYCSIRGATGNPADVVIDAEGLTECARFAGYEKKSPFFICGLTFTNGKNPTKSDATYCALSIVKNVVVSNCVVASCGGEDQKLPPVLVSSARMVGCVISNCVSSAYGSAIRLGVDGVFEKGLITDCRAPTGVYGPVYSYNGGMLRDSVISNNQSRLCAGFYGWPQEISGCLFIDNLITMDSTTRESGTLVLLQTETQEPPSSCVISNCVVTDTQLSRTNLITCAGISIKDIDCSVVGCVVSNIASAKYAGVYAKADTGADIQLIDCKVVCNKATSTSGGGAFLGNGVVAKGCTFSGNSANNAGGGVYGYGFTMVDCVVSNNTAKTGGGVCVVTNGVCAATFSNTTFRCNASTWAGGALSVGFMYKQSCDYTNGYVNAYGCIFEKNHTGAGGNSDSYSGGGAVSLLNEGKSSGLFEGCIFKGNSSDNYGGAFSLRTAAKTRQGLPEVNIRSSLFADNTAAKNGGAIYVVSGDPVNIDCCTFAENIATVGGDTYIRWTGVKARNCVYAQNKFDSDTIYRQALTNCCINAEYLPSSVHSNGVSDKKSDSNGNIAADPGFADAANGDYSLKRDSVCVGRGVMLDWMGRSSKDAAGSKRVCGSLPDLGAFEYYFPVGMKFSVR